MTGGSGFLGQHLVKLLQERDDNCKEIRIVDLVSYTNHLGMLELPAIEYNLFFFLNINFKWNIGQKIIILFSFWFIEL